MHWLGEGTPKNVAEAVKWWTLAAKQENPAAQFDLGTAYKSGQGIAMNLEQAKFWWGKAAGHGLVEAENKLKQLRNERPASAPAPAAAPAPVAAPAPAPAMARGASMPEAPAKVSVPVAAPASLPHPSAKPASAPAVAKPAAPELDATISRILTSLNMTEYMAVFAAEKIDLDAAKLLSEDVRFPRLGVLRCAD